MLVGNVKEKHLLGKMGGASGMRGRAVLKSLITPRSNWWTSTTKIVGTGDGIYHQDWRYHGCGVCHWDQRYHSDGDQRKDYERSHGRPWSCHKQTPMSTAKDDCSIWYQTLEASLRSSSGHLKCGWHLACEGEKNGEGQTYLCQWLETVYQYTFLLAGKIGSSLRMRSGIYNTHWSTT